MTSIHTDKENFMSFRAPPKTPAWKPANAKFRTPSENTVLRAKSHNRSAASFFTPTGARVPLGGKDTNIRDRNNELMTNKRLTTRKRSPELQRNIETVQASKERVLPEDFGDLEIEFIPEKPPPLPDLPLDHLELDYDAIRRGSRRGVFVDEPVYDKKLDQPVEELLSNCFDLESIEGIKVLRDFEWQRSRETRGTHNIKPLGLANQKPVQRLAQRRLEPSVHGRSKPTSLVSSKSFMNPTLSAQAKSVKHSTGSSQTTLSVCSTFSTHSAHSRITQKPSPIDLDISIEELEAALDFDIDL